MGDDWRRYPFELVPGDPQFVFPGRRGEPSGLRVRHVVSCRRTDRRNRSQVRVPVDLQQEPAGARRFVADFYTLALFDLDNGTYGTYTDYDMPPTNMQPRRAAEVVGCRRTPGHALRQRRGHRALADLPRRAGRPGALHLRRQLRAAPTSRRRDAGGPARHPVAGAGAVGRRGLQRQDRVLRAGRIPTRTSRPA